MAQTKLFGKDLSAYDDINIEELLLTLTEQEIDELGQELIDPDVSKNQFTPERILRCGMTIFPLLCFVANSLNCQWTTDSSVQMNSRGISQQSSVGVKKKSFSFSCAETFPIKKESVSPN